MAPPIDRPRGLESDADTPAASVAAAPNELVERLRFSIDRRNPKIRASRTNRPPPARPNNDMFPLRGQRKFDATGAERSRQTCRKSGVNGPAVVGPRRLPRQLGHLSATRNARQ